MCVRQPWLSPRSSSSNSRGRGDWHHLRNLKREAEVCDGPVKSEKSWRMGPHVLLPPLQNRFRAICTANLHNHQLLHMSKVFFVSLLGC